MAQNKETIRYSSDFSICIVDDSEGNFRCADQRDMDRLPVGDDLTQEEIDQLDD